MTVLQKIALSGIRHSRVRFWATVTGVALSTAMILSVLLGSDAAMDALRRFVVGQDGNWHWSADRLPAQAAASLAGDAGCGQWGIFGGRLAAEGPQGTALCLYGTAGDFLKMMQTELAAGALPASPDELLIERQFALRHGLSVGDPLPLALADGSVRPMTVCGIFSHSVLNLQLPADEGGFNAFYGLDWDEPLGEDVYRFFSAAGRLDAAYYAHTGELTGSLLARWPQTIPLYHSTLITLSGAPGPDGTNRALFFISLLRAALLAVIAAASGMMIANSFSISLAERRRTLGMLISAGATGRQAAFCLLYEALAAGAVGIPLGLLAGCGGLGLAFRLLAPLMRGMKQLIAADLSLRLAVRPLWLLVSALISLGVLLLSAWLPARGFAKGSIIEAITGGGEIKVSRSVTHAGKIAGRLLGVEAALAVKSAKRSHRRYAATVSSLAVCIALLIAAAGLARYIPAVADANLEAAEYPIGVNYAVSGQSLPDTGTWQALLHPKTPVDEVRVTETVFLDPLPVAASFYTKENTELAVALNSYREGGDYLAILELCAVPDEEFARRAGRAETPSGAVRCILANRYFYHTQDIVQTHYRAGEALQAQLKGMPVTLSIAAVDQSEYVRHRPGDAARLLMITSQSELDTLLEQWQRANGQPLPRSVTVQYRTAYPQNLKEELEPLRYDGTEAGDPYNYLLLSDNRTALALTRILHLLLNVILYGFSGLIWLICACHVVTTVSTGLALQRREFSMMQSLGMTEKGLGGMILAQSAVHSLEALAWGLPLGAALLWMEYSILRRLAGFLFAVPWGAVVAAVLGAFLLALLAAWPYLRALRKHSILENLRAEG